MAEPEEGLCYVNSTSKFKIIAAVNVAGSFVSLAACLLVTVSILMFKKYIIFSQKLILYLCIAGALNSIAAITRETSYFPDNGSYNYNAYCAWSGYSIQVTIWMFYTALLVVIIHMYLTVVKQKDTHNIVKKVYAILIFIPPVLFNLLPFSTSSYGPAGPWCWIRAINFDRNCSKEVWGIVWRYTLSYVPLLGVALIGILLYILMACHIYRARFTSMYDPQAGAARKAMLKEIRPFLIYPWLFLVILLIAFINRIVVISVTDEDVIVALWIINAAATSSQGGLAAVTFGLDLNTLRRLFNTKSYTCCRWDIVTEYHIQVPDRTDSFVSESCRDYDSISN